ncbi:MAG: CsgG/HfaB family protein [Planctomycetota bacterium]|jgi:TolB-like protein
MRQKLQKTLGLVVTLALIAAFSGALIGCKRLTPQERSRQLHTKYDPWVNGYLTKTEAEFSKASPSYHWILKVHANLLAHLVKLRDPSFNETIADIHSRNAEVYDKLGDENRATVSRNEAVKYADAGGKVSVQANKEAVPETAGGDSGVAATTNVDPTAAPPEIPEVRARIAVLSLDEPPATKDNYGYGSQFSGRLDSALGQTGYFELINRSAIASVIKERNLAETQYIQADEAKKLGRLLEVDFLLVGYIGPNREHDTFNVSAKLVDTVTGKEVANASGLTEKGTAGFGPLAGDVAKQLLDQYQALRRDG